MQHLGIWPRSGWGRSRDFANATTAHSCHLSLAGVTLSDRWTAILAYPTFGDQLRAQTYRVHGVAATDCSPYVLVIAISVKGTDYYETNPPTLLTCDEMIDLGMTVPELLEDLEDALGPEAVWTLTRLFGGTETHIPHENRMATSRVTAQLSESITRWLFKTYGPGRIQIPLGPYSSRALKMAAFRTALLSRQTHRTIAQSLGCHIRTVERAKRELVTAGFL